MQFDLAVVTDFPEFIIVDSVNIRSRFLPQNLTKARVQEQGPNLYVRKGAYTGEGRRSEEGREWKEKGIVQGGGEEARKERERS